MSRIEALRTAKDAELDLVEVSPNANPPVAKIIDWGKYNYQRTKQLQKNKKHSKVADVKQIRLSLKIGSHDIDIKLKKVYAFLNDGHKVKFIVFYRGRELAHKDLGFKLAERIIEILGDEIIVDQPPQFSGKQLFFTVRSNNAKAKNP